MLGLSKLKLTQLKVLSTLLGLPSSGTKSVLLEGIIQASTAVGALGSKISRSSPLVVKSVDMGVRNLSLVNLHAPSLVSGSLQAGASHEKYGKMGISQWKRLDVEKGFRPDSWSPEVSSFDVDRLAVIAHALVRREFVLNTPGENVCKSKSHWPDVILIERQRFRSGSSASTLEWTIRVNMLENMLHAILHTLAPPETVVVASINPKAVLNYWIQRTGTAREEKGYKETKAFKTRLAAAVLGLHYPSRPLLNKKNIPMLDISGLELATAPCGFDILDTESKDVVQILGSAKVKDDDLADSFLQGLAWLEWIEGRRQLGAVVSAHGDKAAATANFAVEYFNLG